jgi:TolB-like protein
VRLIVLPFANMSNDPTQEYFSDGLTEEMITQIGRLCPGRLGVIARTSSMLFKRSAKSASEIGRELSADYLLEGSVRGDGDRVRITAQLIDTRTEVHLWVETYDRSLGETLNVQTEVAGHIARSLAMELVPDQVDVIGRATPRRTEAYQAYLKGRYHWNRGSLEGRALGDFVLRARARARSGLRRFALGHGESPNIARQQFEATGPRTAGAGKGLGASRHRPRPGISDAHLALAEIRRTLEWDWRTAEDAYRTAIALSPSCESAHRFYAQFLAAMSRFGEAKSEADRACDVDPFCLLVTTSAAWVRYAAGEFESAVDRSRQVLDMDASYMPARRLLGAALLGAGKSEEAVAELTAAAGPDGEDAVSLAWLAHAKALAGERDEAGRSRPGSHRTRRRVCAAVSPRHRSYGPRRSRRRICACSRPRAPIASRLSSISRSSRDSTRSAGTPLQRPASTAPTARIDST